MAKLSSNFKANTVLPPGTRGVQPFLIGPGEPRATSFLCATCVAFDVALLTFYGTKTEQFEISLDFF